MTPSSFAVESETLEDGILAFSVTGELDLDTVPQLESPVERVLSHNGEDASVLIDLSSCDFIDSTGIALLVRTWQRLDSESEGKGRGRLVICCSNDQVERLLKITGVESSIPLHRDRDAALADLRG